MFKNKIRSLNHIKLVAFLSLAIMPLKFAWASSNCEITYSNGTKVSALEPDTNSCLTYAGQKAEANPDLQIVSLYFGSEALPIPPSSTQPPPLNPGSTSICKIDFSSGGSVSSSQPDTQSCLNYFNQIQASNPQLMIVSVYFGSQVLVQAPQPPAPQPTGQVCKVNFMGGASAASTQVDIQSCLNYSNQIHLSNPQLVIVSVYFGSQALVQAPPPPPPPPPSNQINVCKVTFVGGGSIATTTPSLASCLDYFNVVRANNPQLKVYSVYWNSQRLY